MAALADQRCGAGQGQAVAVTRQGAGSTHTDLTSDTTPTSARGSPFSRRPMLTTILSALCISYSPEGVSTMKSDTYLEKRTGSQHSDPRHVWMKLRQWVLVRSCVSKVK